ncbi:tetratricopeptide repeat protein [Marinicella sp. S1101]|uniref:heme biosynthesis HemY N-terminal domain-containing protein n=1 Tax=Marinicella marina TaxID=2996016 RepID=UPI0022609443|nr:heme biosynthesis HemY N-terminal domain-containing protein [Marinicella marina]MCX7552380.1 tetratricopeptide repeat protein [Marinicella marina]MDJ1139255.1 heme biosynthesis HemY N-terminal domain-containing protein [Marinicella marina]
MLKTIKVILLIILLLAVAWLTPQLIKNPGLIQVELLGYQIQMTAIAAGILLLLVFVAIWFIYGLLKAPKKAINHLTANHSRKKFARGLLALSEGKWSTAEKLLVASAQKSPTPELSFMAAARAAVAQNDLQRAEAHLDEAEKVIDNPLTVDLTRCEIWVKSGQAEKALPLLATILNTYPNNPRAVHLQTQASQQTQDWKLLQSTIPKAEKLAIINHQQSNELKTKVTLERFAAASSESELDDIWHALSKKQQQSYRHSYCETGLRLGAYQQVTGFIEKSMKNEFDEQMVTYWSALPYNLNHRLKVAEKWLVQHPNQAAVLLCNAKLHVEKKNWDKAESLLLEVLKTTPSQEVHQLLGLIYQEKEQPDEALAHFRAAVLPNDKALSVIEDSDNTE